MIACDLVHIMWDILVNPELKNDMFYGPERIWTLPAMKIQVYGDTNSGQWWWDEQVSLIECSSDG